MGKMVDQWLYHNCNNNDSSLSIDVKLPGALRPPLSYQRSDRHTLYLPDCL